MIAFKDFVPQELESPRIFSAGKYALVDQAVEAANDWIRQNGVKVLNVETVVLPNMTNSGEEGTGDAKLRVAGSDMASDWYQFVRVWYATA